MNPLKEYKKLNTRPCSVVTVGGFRPSNNPLASTFFLTSVGKPGEDWPVHNGEPLAYICQLNLTEAPYVPDMLKDIAILTFYINVDQYLAGERSEGTWCIRAYSSLEGLVPLQPPKGSTPRKGFECRWELQKEDYPVYDDPELAPVPGVTEEKLEELLEDQELYNLKKTKIGGWASNIQHPQSWNCPDSAEPAFCLQINSEEKVRLNWVDSGTIYIARNMAKSEEPEWFLDLQFY